MKIGTMSSKDFVAGKSKDFFHQKHCDRCKKEFGVARTMSWFTEETICMPCSNKESELKSKLREAGIDDSEIEGCGYVPDL